MANQNGFDFWNIQQGNNWWGEKQFEYSPSSSLIPSNNVIDVTSQTGLSRDFMNKKGFGQNPYNIDATQQVGQPGTAPEGISVKLNEVSANPQQSLGDRFSNGVLGKNASAINAGIDAVGNIASMFSRGQSTYNGPKGDVRAGIEQGWNTMADAAANFGPYGKLVSLGMKATGALNNIQGAIFGATDGMTTTDAIMDSPLGFLTGVGWVNQAFGQNADTITKDEEAFEQVGSSYGGTSATVDSALEKSGKKYGAFSTGALHRANREIAEAKRQQSVMANIADMASDRFSLRNSMAAINGNRRALAMQGGYNQSAVRVGRNGLSLQNIATAKRVVSVLKFRHGNKTEDPFHTYLQSLPKEQRDSTDFRVKDYWEFNGRPRNFEEAVSKGMFTKQPDGWHANSVAENPLTGEIEFMKSSSHPSHHMEVEWYNSDDASEFRSQYELQKTEPYWKYVKRKPQGDAVDSFQQGGVLEVSLEDIPEEYLEPLSTVEEVTLDSILPEFREGGKVNVIPEGALHARLHHMENADNLTKKGIPVVAEKEGGELEQQAEIERNEVILRLELTQELENLRKKYESSEYTQKEKDQFAIEAGKLLTYELLENTVDNTGLLNEV